MKGIMDILKPRDELRYEIAITFTTDRNQVEALIPVREYRRMIKQYRQGKPSGTYEMVMDGHVTEYTFPLQEIDTIIAVPEITDE